MIKVYYSNLRQLKPQEEQVVKKGSWVYCVEPSKEDLDNLADEFKLERDLLEDAKDIYETPRIERDGGNTYVYARYCFPRVRDVSTEPILIVYTQDHIITILRTESDVLLPLMTGKTQVATTQRTKLFLRILSAVNGSYEKDINKVNKQIFAIRTKLKKAEIVESFMVEFIDTEENLNEYLIALQPQVIMLRNLLNGKFLPLYEEDKDLVEDLTLGGNELIDLIKSRLKTISNIRDAYNSLLANNLNRIFKRLTSIGIFLTVPTIVGSFYGMNLFLPGASNTNAFWDVLGVTAAFTILTVLLFKKLRWL